jgi:hypothetical protein
VVVVVVVVTIPSSSSWLTIDIIEQFSIQKANSEFSRRISNSANEVSIQRDSMRAGSRQPSRHRIADDAY